MIQKLRLKSLLLLLLVSIGIGQVSALPPAQQSTLSQIAASANGGVSVHLPEGWLFDTPENPQYTALIAFGDSTNTLQTMVDTMTGSDVAAVDGSSGFVGVLDPALYADMNQDEVIDNIFTLFTTPEAGVEVVSQKTRTFADGAYSGWFAQINSTEQDEAGYVAVFGDGTVVVMALVATMPSANLSTLENEFVQILQSIRIPGESASQAGAATSTPSAGAAGEVTLVRGEDDRLSVELPSNWLFNDLLASDNLFLYGNSEVAVLSRLFSVRPDLTESLLLTGSGGLIILYTPEALGLPPDFDQNALMAQVLSGIEGQGFTVAANVVELQLEQGLLLYAMVEGTETGYIALAFLDDQIVYMTATGDSGSFNADQEALYAILNSLHVPAASEQTATPSGGGGIVPLQTATPSGGIAPAQTATPSSGGGGRIVPVGTAQPTESGGGIAPTQTATPSSGTGGRIVPAGTAQPTESGGGGGIAPAQTPTQSSGGVGGRIVPVLPTPTT